MVHERAGTRAREEDLVDLEALLNAYHLRKPDVGDPEQAVVFGTSGHRGSSLDAAFNEDHIVAITQAIVDYRRSAGITGPLLLGRDPHALSEPAWRTVIEVLAANEVTVYVASDARFTPTPAVSRAVLEYNRGRTANLADGIVVTPSHNPPRDGGIKYNETNGGPADSSVTKSIAHQANSIIREGLTSTKRMPFDEARNGPFVVEFDFLHSYVDDLPNVVDIKAIRDAGIRIGADAMGGAATAYWAEVGERHSLDITIVNPVIDPTWRSMTLDTDGKIRMDCSSPNAMASLIENRHLFDIATGNDADSDRHGIVTPDGGLMNPNHFLAVAIKYLLDHRPEWNHDVAIGKTLVSSSMIDRVAAKLGRTLIEVPVGFKWFVPGLLDGTIGFGGEESAGASFLRRDGSVWTTDKDGIIMALLASEILAVTGKTPSQHYAELTEEFGNPVYARVDAPATRKQKDLLAALSPETISVTELAGEAVTTVLSHAPGNNAPIGGVKVVTENAWFAARPSGTEDVYKIYAESFLGPDHLTLVQSEAKTLVDSVLAGETT